MFNYIRILIIMRRNYLNVFHLIVITTFIFISVSNSSNTWAYDSEGNKKPSVNDDATSCESQEERWERIKKERGSKPSSNTATINSSDSNTVETESQKKMEWQAPTDKNEIEKVCYKINIKASMGAQPTPEKKAFYEAECRHLSFPTHYVQ